MYRILYISHTTRLAGAEVSLLSLLKEIDRTKYFPIVAIPEDGPLLRRLKDIKVKIQIMSMTNFRGKNPFSIFPYLKTIYRLVELIKKEKINLIHCNMYTSNQYSVIASLLTGVPLMCHMRNIINRRCYYNNFLFLTKTLIANSRATEKGYKRYLKRSQESNIIYNGVKFSNYQPSIENNGFRKRYGITGNAFLIGCVGQIQELKGHHILIESISRLINRYPNIRLFIAGDDSISGEAEYSYKLKEMCKTLNLRDKVIFGGFINNMTFLYSNIDLLVLPATYEPFGRVLIEAMAFKKPVVGTFVGGVPEVVENGVSGILVEPGDSYALECAIEKILKDDSLGKKMGEEGYKRAKDLFCSKIHIQKVQSLYNKIISEKESGVNN